MKPHFAIVALGLMTGLAAIPAAASTYLFTLSGSGYTGSGTITSSGSVSNPWPCGTCAVGPGQLVTAITGTLNGNAITGPTAPGTTAGNNNHIYPSGGPFLDWGDLGFSSNGVDYNAFNGNYAGHPGYFLATSNSGVYANPINFTLSAVPEPASWALMIAGFGLVGATLRRRVRATA